MPSGESERTEIPAMSLKTKEDDLKEAEELLAVKDRRIKVFFVCTLYSY